MRVMMLVPVFCPLAVRRGDAALPRRRGASGRREASESVSHRDEAQPVHQRDVLTRSSPVSVLPPGGKARDRRTLRIGKPPYGSGNPPASSLRSSASSRPSAGGTSRERSWTNANPRGH